MILQLPKHSEDAALKVGDFIHRTVRKQNWDLPTLEAMYLKRDWRAILISGTTNAYGPCPERTIVASRILVENDIKAKVIFHEWVAPGFTNSVIHLIIAIPKIGECDRPVTLEFSTSNTLCRVGTYDKFKVEQTKVLAELPVSEFAVDGLDPSKKLKEYSSDANDMSLLYKLYARRAKPRVGEYEADIFLYDDSIAKLNMLYDDKKRKSM